MPDDGLALGRTLGDVDGAADGDSLGEPVGLSLGISLGDVDGEADGEPLGASVGAGVASVGEPLGLVPAAKKHHTERHKNEPRARPCRSREMRVHVQY